ncbi:MAG: exonuclease domain-containing protein [Pseudomonadota bacterium]
MFGNWRFERALRALENHESAAIQSYADADWPDRKLRAADVPFLALDFELDGLRKDAHLLQAGWLPLEGRQIPLSKAQSLDIRSDAALDPDAVAIHGIGEQRAAQGEKISHVIAALIDALSGRVLVAHAAAIEREALQRAAKAVFGVALPVRSVCTLSLEQRIHPNLVGGEAYRLGPARERYGLPDYGAHDALTDAIAAAELFQAQLSRLPASTTLSEIETA